MKILHVLDHSLPIFSGYSFRSSNILQFQKTIGMEPIALTSPKHGREGTESEEIGGIRYFRTPEKGRISLTKLPLFKEALVIQRLRKRLRQVVNSENVDLIHSHSPSLNGFPAWLVARRCRIPFVYEARAFWEDAAVDRGTFGARSWRYAFSRIFESFVFRRADAVIVIAEEMKRDLIARGLPEDRIFVVGNGVDLEMFQPRERNIILADQLGLDGGPVFGFVGSFYHYEGLELLLESFAGVRKQIPNARLLVIGGGPREQAIREAAKKFDRAVTILGHVPHQQVPDFYSVIDVLVYPRRKMRLTDLVTPLKPLEAMAMAKAVLASDVGGHRELIQHGRTGFLFRSDDGEALTTAAVQLAKDTVLRNKLSTSARTYIEVERGWRTVVKNYVHIYETVLSKG
jgi:PEP-CTERM/exosortase A-associated glycosyltransferase